MRTLYASDDLGDRLTPFDPTTGTPGTPIPVTDPYNLYFTPDGRSAVSVAEAHRELVFYDPHTWAVQDTLPTPDCAGIDHADFTPDGRTAVFTCEFAGRVAVVDVAAHRLLRMVDMPHRNTTMGPQDIKLAPDGSVFYIADSDQNGLWVLDGAATKVVREIPTGMGAHGLYLSRDATKLYVTNRHEGSVSVLDAYTGAPLAKWTIPGGGSPDMGNVTADGTQLWLSGRYDRSVYVLSTADGHLIRKIDVGSGPARPVLVAPTGPVLARPHRDHPMMRSVVGSRSPRPFAVIDQRPDREPVCSAVVQHPRQRAHRCAPRAGGGGDVGVVQQDGAAAGQAADHRRGHGRGGGAPGPVPAPAGPQHRFEAEPRRRPATPAR